MSKEIVLMLHRMAGGGAERVMLLLANWLAKKGNKVSLILVEQKLCDAVKYEIEPSVELLSLKDIKSDQESYITKRKSKAYTISSKVSIRLSKLLHKAPADKATLRKYLSKYTDELNVLDELISKKPKANIVAFLDSPIHLSLLMKEKYPDLRVVISERNDPQLHESSKSATLFIKKYYGLADAIVFQSTGAKEGYRSDLQAKGKIIHNPLTADLPQRFVGERKKKIVNFCRISNQKNLPLLIDAFAKFHKNHSDYTLDIFGDAINAEGKEVLNTILGMINNYGLSGFVDICPFDPKLHNCISDYAMFVSSSDYEGMSNSMIEAMAIGLPTICTDCPSGGAREIIVDHVNGLLTPVKDADALCAAMSEVADSKELSDRLSENATKIKEDLSVDKIMKEWWSVIDA